MKNKKGILLNNAYESWSLAIKIAHQMMAGMVTLQKRKQFVSSLHNAVELFLKQIMLDNNDHRVATVKPNQLDPSGEPLTSYFDNNDLNNYFDNLTSLEAKKYMSIEFNELVNFHKELLNGYAIPNQSFATELNLLKILRNSETHFSIKEDLFLTCSEFIKLYNFMIDFYDVLQFKNLLPVFSTPSEDTSRLYFKVPKIKNKNLSYETLIKKSVGANIAFNIITQNTIYSDLPSFYDLATIYKDELSRNNISVEDGATYIKALLDYRFIDFDVHYDIVEKGFEQYEPDFDGYELIVLKNL